MKKITLLVSVCLFVIIANTYSQVLPTSISVNPASISMHLLSAPEFLEVTVLPLNTTDNSVTFTSSNNTVATVTSNGIVSPVGIGTAEITIRCNADSQIFTTVPVTVEFILPTSITISPITLNIQLGATALFTYTMLPAETTNTAVTWTSSNPAVATISANGFVTAISSGTATITATSVASGISASATVICNFSPITVTGIQCDVSSNQLFVGDTTLITPIIIPVNATDKTVTYSSSNPAIATVSAIGEITANTPGTVTITTRANDNGQVTCSQTITVNALPVETNKCTNHDAPQTLYDTIQYVVSAQDQLRGFAEVTNSCIREMNYIYASNINRSYYRFNSEEITVEIPVLQQTLDFYVWGYNTVEECYSDSAKIVFVQTPCMAGNVDIVGNTEITINPEDALPILQATGTDITWFDANYELISQSSTLSIASLPIPLHTGTLRLYAASKYSNCYGNPDSVKINIITYKIQGTVDAFVSGMKVTITQNGVSRIVPVNADSTFTFETRTPGEYTVELQHNDFQEINKTATATVSNMAPLATISFTNINDLLSQISDVSTSISSITPAVVGRDLWYHVNIVNNGLPKIDLPLAIRLDSNFIVNKVYVNGIDEQINFDSNNENTYTIPSISSFSTIHAYINGNVKPDWTITGKKMETMVYIPQNTDSNPRNDTAKCIDVILNSCDPNDKAVSPSFGEEGYVLFNQPLEYRIRFQNTGSFNAENIVIKDTIDSNLNIASFAVTNQSHPMTWQIENNVVTFSFANIYLPDSTSDEPGSHGFVTYTISPNQGLGENTIVENTAHIFFDFNPAVVTNTTVSEYVSSFPEIIVDPLSINENSKSDITIYPVPAKENIVITNCIGAQVIITDIHGKTVKTIPYYIGNKISIIDLPQGMYNVKVDNNKAVLMIKK